ncbi:Valine--tRNA ligase [subsurface metagenome]
MPESIMIAPYPAADGMAVDDEAEKRMALVIEVIRAIRNARAEFRVEPSKWIEAVAVVEEKPTFESQAQAIETLARVRPLAIVSSGEGTMPTEAKALVLEGAEVILPMAGMVDLDAERERLEREIEATQEQVLRIEARLKDEEFLSRAPANIVARDKERLATNRDKIGRLKQKIAELGGKPRT